MGECFELDLEPYATGEVSSQALKWTLMALADHAHMDGSSARPSAKTIAWKTDLGLRTVNRALKQLEVVGAIEAIGEKGSKTGQPTSWQLRFDDLPRKKLGVSQTGIPSETGGMPVGGLGGKPVVAHEPSLTKVSSETTSPQRPAAVDNPRQDPVWDALADQFGKPGHRQAEKERGKVRQQLAGAGIETGEQVVELVAEYRRTFTGEVALTQHALGKHADQLAHEIKKRGERRQVKPCEFCGVGGNRHSAECPEAEAA